MKTLNHIQGAASDPKSRANKADAASNVLKSPATSPPKSPTKSHKAKNSDAYDEYEYNHAPSTRSLDKRKCLRYNVRINKSHPLLFHEPCYFS